MMFAIKMKDLVSEQIWAKQQLYLSGSWQELNLKTHSSDQDSAADASHCFSSCSVQFQTAACSEPSRVFYVQNIQNDYDTGAAAFVKRLHIPLSLSFSF